ncbi:MAG: hypothetical protein ACKO6N_25700 [Myxococcota bacterium]
MRDESMSSERPIPCRHLRTKMFYISDALGLRYLERTLPAESYWCLHTMTPTGLDDRPAEPDCCDARRPCYEPVSASLLAFDVSE